MIVTLTTFFTFLIQWKLYSLPATNEVAQTEFCCLAVLGVRNPIPETEKFRAPEKL